MSTQPTVLISGAAGQLGRLVLDDLLARKFAGKIIAGTRDPSKLGDLASRRIEVRKLDWTDETSLASAFTGVDRVLLISGDQIQDRSENQVRAVKAAATAGVKHITYTSMVAPERYQEIPIAPSHLGTEQAIKASGVGYAILQNMWYPDPLLDALKKAVASGRWDTTNPDGKIAYVSREDCARAAAAALAAPTSPTGTFVITGPEALSPRDIAGVAAQLTNKPIAIGTLTDDQVSSGMKAGGLPQFVIDIVVGIDRFNREGAAAPISGDYEKLTGHKATSVRDWLRARAGELS